ncbi:hyaluronan and proteoglycan link protein 1 [Latimeria chalumnae]|uniref:hyaluronan and proteoglycan link protein 1 n=1 Tax=Latimeria chalumnae TaxID=7897 RepID=UPI0003C15CA7|nr:PREDICTED: hyaluronan and proteoglycan link protein 1 [Latimeria chalumnae]XP_005996718.1 PREDICTED: hyaluronan and proteoglycan link protein 1 [Latimeria chalumnae]XP_005996719.1 PREDICTED: hyaluronan and proteoglycan link protein 1 [Latimeria chalumnae]|eukprot:XP_005996717.1 PREDICTED: hyaluronan and proteoglycan link protein 1 [Latimeria chalumnae]
MNSLVLLVLFSVCWAEHHSGNSTADHDRIIHIQENGPRLIVEAEQTKVLSHRNGHATLPCKYSRDLQAAASGPSKIRIKWTKLTQDYLKEIDVFVAMGNHRRSYGSYQGRVFLQESCENDASLVITSVTLADYGRYKCEVIEGLEDGTVVIALDLQGVVFPFFPRVGRYNLNFQEAQQACVDQDAAIASFDQLYDAWRSGLDWCNAGWLSDGSVQYPITKPREPCGGKNTIPGVRNYGYRDKEKNRYDVFCFTSNFKGRFYYLIHPTKLTYDEAVQACLNDGSQIAKVGQMYAAWKLLGYDRCDAGWLADGSVRYPISRPRRRCSPNEAAVRFGGFPDKKHKLYGVYCFRASN